MSSPSREGLGGPGRPTTRLTLVPQPSTESSTQKAPRCFNREGRDSGRAPGARRWPVRRGPDGRRRLSLGDGGRRLDSKGTRPRLTRPPASAATCSLPPPGPVRSPSRWSEMTARHSRARAALASRTTVTARPITQILPCTCHTGTVPYRRSGGLTCVHSSRARQIHRGRAPDSPRCGR